MNQNGRDHQDRRRRTSGRGTLALALTSVLIGQFSACAGSPPAARPACGRCEDETRFVRLATPEPEGHDAPSYQHPLRLRPEEWRHVLSLLNVQKRYQGFLFFPGQKGPVEPAFLPEEIDYLSTALSAAFDRAQPDEWVVFGLTRPAASEVSEVTTGAWFVTDGQLHLRLANYRYAVSMRSLRELLWEHPLRGHEIRYDLIPAEHQTLRHEPESRFLFKAKPVELRIAHEAVLAEPPSAHPMPGPQPADQPQMAPAAMTIEGRLRTLKRLKDEGLLTEEEYLVKKRQLLEQF